jgi:hypothetical protein
LKSPCDGIGGTVKRLAARASLQATETGHILTPHELYDWAVGHIEGIKFLFVSSLITCRISFQECSKNLQSRFESLKTVAGTRSHHRFIPLTTSSIGMRRLSSDAFQTTVTLAAGDNEVKNDISAESIPQNITPGQYVAAVYDGKWYIGMVTEWSQEHGDVVINFMTRNVDSNTITWPSRKDECAVPLENVFHVVPAPVTMGSSGRQYKLVPEVLEDVLRKFSSFQSK